MMKNKLISRKKYENLISSLPSGYCPFCDIKKQIVLGESKHWVWIATLAPYWKYHTLVIPKKHKLDLTDITNKEFENFKKFYRKIVEHLLRLNLRHENKKPIDQFILMIRIREESILGGSTYYKPRHLHVHLVPDKEGVERFIIDKAAVRINIKKLAFAKKSNFYVRKKIRK